jgi:hypothetical protein
VSRSLLLIRPKKVDSYLRSGPKKAKGTKSSGLVPNWEQVTASKSTTDSSFSSNYGGLPEDLDGDQKVEVEKSGQLGRLKKVSL